MGKKFMLKILPFILSFFVGVIFYVLSLKTFNSQKLLVNIPSLCINISASFISIPLIFIFYNLSQLYVEKELKKEIVDYIKYKVDGEILEIVTWLRKMVYPLNNWGGTKFSEINDFLNIKKIDVIDKIKSKEYLGFQLLKEWNLKIQDIEKCLNNTLITKYLSDEQLISLIKIINCLNILNKIHENINDNFVDMGKKAKGFLLLKPDELKLDEKLKKRMILLKGIDKNKGVVVDYGDFESLNNLLTLYKIKDNSTYSEVVYKMIYYISYWFKQTNCEIIINPNKARVRCLEGDSKKCN